MTTLISKAEFTLKDSTQFAPGKMHKLGSEPETSAAAAVHPGITAMLRPTAAAIPVRRVARAGSKAAAAPRAGTWAPPQIPEHAQAPATASSQHLPATVARL